MTKDKKHLYDLDELSDYKVADGYPNVKGWNVKDKDNRVIGEVENLLVNLDSQRVVYLDIEVDKTIIDANYDPYSESANPEVREFINKEGENHVIVPIGLVDINEKQKYVYTDKIDHRTFAETKRYKKGTDIDREYEVAVLDSYKRSYDDKEILNEDRVRTIVRKEVKDMDVPTSKELEYKKENKVREIVREEIKTANTDRTRSEVIQNEISTLEERKNSRLAAERWRLLRDDFKRDNRDSDGRRGVDFDNDNDGNPNITDPDYYEDKRKGRQRSDSDNDGIKDNMESDSYDTDNKRRRNRENENDRDGMDFDHDNDGNPNITDPDYYEEKRKGRQRSESDNDGIKDNRNSDSYDTDNERRRSRENENDRDGMDFDHDNDGNPNITDPDYYDDKMKGRNKDGRTGDRDSDTYDSDLESRHRNKDVNDDDDFYARREFRNQSFKKD